MLISGELFSSKVTALCSHFHANMTIVRHRFQFVALYNVHLLEQLSLNVGFTMGDIFFLFLNICHNAAVLWGTV